MLAAQNSRLVRCGHGISVPGALGFREQFALTLVSNSGSVCYSLKSFIASGSFPWSPRLLLRRAWRANDKFDDYWSSNSEVGRGLRVITAFEGEANLKNEGIGAGR